MAEKELDYHIDDDLEQLFHSELQNLALGHEETDHDDVIGDHLPEWLVGVIVVIAILIVAFFVMIVTSLIKNRKKQRSSSYMESGTPTTCDDLESGKVGQSTETIMKMTSLTSVPDTVSEISKSVANSSSHEQLISTSGDFANGEIGRKNPIYVDDDVESDENNSDKNNTKNEIENNKENKKASFSGSDVNITSTSSGFRGSDVTDHGRSKGIAHKCKSSSSPKKSVSSMKMDLAEADKLSDNEFDPRKRIFTSKIKCGNNTSTKRDVIEEETSYDEISENDEESDKAEEVIEVRKIENFARSTTEIPLETKIKGGGTCGSCEDSGVELSSSESRLMEETGAGSELDDFGSNKDVSASQVITMECSNDFPLPENAKCTPTSLTGQIKDTLSDKLVKDTAQKGSIHMIVSNQNSSMDCNLQNLEPSLSSVSKEENKGLVKKPTVLQQIRKDLDNMDDTVRTKQEPNNKETKMPVDDLWEGTTYVLCQLQVSEIVRAEEPNKIKSADKCAIAHSTVLTSTSSSPETATTTELNHREKQEEITDLDKALSTNL